MQARLVAELRRRVWPAERGCGQPCAAGIRRRVLATVLLLGGGLGWALAQHGAPAPAVTVVKVEKTHGGTGQIEAKDKVDLRARVEGLPQSAALRGGADGRGRPAAVRDRESAVPGRDRTGVDAVAHGQATLDLAGSSGGGRPSWSRSRRPRKRSWTMRTAGAGEARADLRRQQANLTTAEEISATPTSRRRSTSGSGRAAYSVGEFVGPSSGTLAAVVGPGPDVRHLPG